MTDKQVERLKGTCTAMIEEYNKSRLEIIDDLDQGPIYANWKVEWWDNRFLVIARAALATEILDSLADAASKGEPLAGRVDFLRDHIQREVNNMAGAPRKSTSTMDTLMHKLRLQANSEALDWIARA